MPLLHQCVYPGCRTLVSKDDRYCSRHRERGEALDQTRKAEREERRRKRVGSASSRGYGYAWKKRREAFLRENPLCVECLKRGLYVPATDVDHIVPHKGDMEKFWDWDNLQALCHECHSRKTAREDGGFGNATGK